MEVLGGRWRKSSSGPYIHFFLSAFSAALVLAPVISLGVVALITPTATVCLMSRTANLSIHELDL